MARYFYGLLVTRLTGFHYLILFEVLKNLRDNHKLLICFTVAEGTTGEASAEDMPPLEGEEGDDPSKMEEVD